MCIRRLIIAHFNTDRFYFLLTLILIHDRAENIYFKCIDNRVKWLTLLLLYGIDRTEIWGQVEVTGCDLFSHDGEKNE